MADTLRMLVPPTSDGRFTAKASAIVSGGYLVGWSSGTDVVTSGTTSLSSYAWDDFVVARVDSQLNCVGIAGETAASGNELAVYFNGVYILPAGSVAVSGGFPIIPSGYEDRVELSVTMGSVAPIGRALTTATLLTGYAIVHLNI